MKLYQLAHDFEAYGEQAGFWLVVTDDNEEELSAPYPSRNQALNAMEEIRQRSASMYPTFKPDPYETLNIFAWALLIASILLGLVAIHGG
jgi:hypothetical protein